MYITKNIARAVADRHLAATHASIEKRYTIFVKALRQAYLAEMPAAVSRALKAYPGWFSMNGRIDFKGGTYTVLPVPTNQDYYAVYKGLNKETAKKLTALHDDWKSWKEKTHKFRLYIIESLLACRTVATAASKLPELAKHLPKDIAKSVKPSSPDRWIELRKQLAE